MVQCRLQLFHCRIQHFHLNYSNMMYTLCFHHSHYTKELKNTLIIVIKHTFYYLLLLQLSLPPSILATHKRTKMKKKKIFILKTTARQTSYCKCYAKLSRLISPHIYTLYMCRAPCNIIVILPKSDVALDPTYYS